jgi:thioredoxin 1
VSGNVTTVDQNSFQKTVLEAQKPVLVDFSAPWCAPCRAVHPIVSELAKEYDGKAEFAEVNVDEAPFVASRYSIMSIPALIIFKDGKPVEHVIGFKPKDHLKKLLDSTLAK